MRGWGVEGRGSNQLKRAESRTALSHGSGGGGGGGGGGGRWSVAGTGSHFTPFGIDDDVVAFAFVGVGRQRFAVALLAARTFTHVQQARPGFPGKDPTQMIR